MVRIGGVLREGAATPQETAQLQRETRAELDQLATGVRNAIQEAGRIETVLAQADRRIRAVEEGGAWPSRPRPRHGTGLVPGHRELLFPLVDTGATSAGLTA